MSEQSETYRVVRGAIRLPRGKTTGFTLSRRDMVMQGELLPPGLFPESDIRSWLDEGRIEPAGVSIGMAEEQARIRSANPFQVDPSTLVGKTMEDLLLLVMEIDPDYDADQLKNEKDAVRLLTSGWGPHMRQVIAPVNDRSRPQALVLDKLTQEVNKSAVRASQGRDLSAEAKAGLEAAKARAQAPETAEE